MKRDCTVFFILLLFSFSIFSQNDTLSSKELKKRKKFIKYKKKTEFNDTLILSNGNIIVGEFKRMDKSIITFKTKYSDSDFKIKWHKVLEIQSDRIFIISLDDGTRLSSSIHSSKINKGKVILDSGDTITIVNGLMVYKSILEKISDNALV